MSLSFYDVIKINICFETQSLNIRFQGHVKGIYPDNCGYVLWAEWKLSAEKILYGQK